MAEDQMQQGDDRAIAKWLAEVDLYDRETQAWAERRKKIVRRYKDDRSPRESKVARFNVLWSNTQTLLPTLYARNPKPDVQRRFKDADPVGRSAADVLERAVSFFCNTDRFGSSMRQSVLDYLLAGRGTVWVRYVPHMQPVAGVEVTDDEDAPEVLEREDVEVDFVHAEDFGHNVSRTWEEVWCVWRIAYLTRAECVQRFGEERGNKPPLDCKGDYGSKSKTSPADDGVDAKSSIYELWDRKRQCAVWFHRDVPEALDYREDPLALHDFFPCPKPLLANCANDSTIPVPDFAQYQDQADELDTITARIASIKRALKVAGVYDASAPGIDRLLSEGVENKLIPVDNWAVFAEKGGIGGAISLLPLKDIVAALTALYEARQQVKNDLYEITGIADIVRGNTQAEETATAQLIKSQFATTRISDRQRDVQRFVRETIRIMSDIICGHFQAQSIREISGVQLFSEADKQLLASKQPPQIPPDMTPDQFRTVMQAPSWEKVIGLLRDKPLRSFRVDIETDSIIKSDEEAEKASRIEFLKAAGGFLNQAASVGAQQPELVPLLSQMLMFGVRAFPVGKELEGAFDAAIAALEKQASSGQPKPNPEVMKAQAEMQLAREKAQLDAQVAQAQQQAQAKQSAQENAMENQREIAKLAMEERLQMQRIQLQAEASIRVAHIEAAAKIEVARITTAISDGQQAEQRESAGEVAAPQSGNGVQQQLAGAQQ